MASVPVYCLCRQPYDMSHFMIECDLCQDWFHGNCVGIEENNAADIDIYHCPDCEVLYGPSIMKNNHGYSKAHKALRRKPVKTGSPMFIHELQGKTFDSSDEVILKPTGSQLTVEFLEESSFSIPILVLKKEGLGMTLPPASFTVRDVEQYIGSDKEIDVIDVACQASCKMMLGDFVKYYYSGKREKVFSVISLEFSNTRLSNIVEMPKIVRKISWIENLWPEECGFERPNVQKYCFMSVQNSYIDFHIEFGGTSVWYHVLKGEKIFYLIHPTNANLTLFECWNNSSKQKETFFGDQVDKCYKCSVKQGQTLFIPTGWIHAVLTPVDCLAFGGNFLHSLNIEMQLKAYETEKQLSTANHFKFPSFETICWHVGKQILDILEGLRENGRCPAFYLVRGGKALNMAFQAWTRKEVLPDHEDEIPKTVQTIQLIEDLARELCLVEDIFQQNIQKMNSIFELQQPFPTNIPSLTWPTNFTSVSRPTLSLPSKCVSKNKDSKHKEIFKKAEQNGKMSPAMESIGRHNYNLIDLSNHQLLKAGSSPEVEFNITSTCLNDSEDGSKSDKIYNGNESPATLLMANESTKRVKSLSKSWTVQIPQRKDNSRVVEEQGIGDKFDLGSNNELQTEERPGEDDMSLRVTPKVSPNVCHGKVCSGQNQIHEQRKTAITPESCITDEEMMEGVEDMFTNGSGSGRILDLCKARKQVGGHGCVVISEDPDSSSNKEDIQDIVFMVDLQSSPPSPDPSSLQARWSGEQDQSNESSIRDPGTVSQYTPGKWPIKRLVYWRTQSTEENTRVDKQDSLDTCLEDAEHVYLSLESDDDDDDDSVLETPPKKRRRSDDPPWIPRACVIPTLPKQNRPMRKSTRAASSETAFAASSETAFAAAATKLAQQVNNMQLTLRD